jgi:tetratricopeptide (TPR) repeat protein
MSVWLCIEPEKDPKVEDAHYLQASSLSNLERYDDAYAATVKLMGSVGDPSDRAIRLRGFLCTKMTNPNFIEAREMFSRLVDMFPEDLNVRLERACCYISIQEWDLALEDLDFILYYQPALQHVVCLR